MEDRTSYVSGFLKYSGSIPELRDLLRRMGFTPSEGDTHHVSIQEFSHVMFREYSESEYMIEADADTQEEMVSDMNTLISACLEHKVGYSIEIYDLKDDLIFNKKDAYDA